MLRQNLLGVEVQSLEPGQDVIRWNDCPDCKGRGYFLINPFATGGSNFCGGIANMTQCKRCEETHAYWKLHGKLPEAEATT